MQSDLVNCPTPYLLIDLAKVRKKVRCLKTALPGVEIFYSMKANAEPRIVQTLIGEGCGIEVSSSLELNQPLSCGLSPEKILSSNPIKTPAFLRELHRSGVRRMAFDSTAEVDKIARYAPNSEVYLRIAVDNSGADFPLATKYGAGVEEAPALLRYAQDRGLTPIGLTFHVGSQCRDAMMWRCALERCAWVMEQVSTQMELTVIDLGGGLPIQHTKPIPALAEIAEVLNDARDDLFGDQVRYFIEPGRYLVGDSAILVASVIGKARRNNENWLYLDVGVFNGLMETVDQFTYTLDFDVPEGRPWGTSTIGGPTCDPTDIIFSGQSIPDLEINERVYFLNAGAYTLSYASYFNGFAPPAVVYRDTACRPYITTLPDRLQRHPIPEPLKW